MFLAITLVLYNIFSSCVLQSTLRDICEAYLKGFDIETTLKGVRIKPKVAYLHWHELSCTVAIIAY